MPAHRLWMKSGTSGRAVYIDRSLVEGFFNDSKSISMRSYSDFESQGLSLGADGESMVEELYVAEMNSLYK